MTDDRASSRDWDFIRAGADWTWAVDAELRLTDVSYGLAAWTDRSIVGLVGEPISALGELGPGPLAGDGIGQPFDDQHLALAVAGRVVHFRLAGRPRTDAGGGFAGYCGIAMSSEPAGDGEGRQRLLSGLGHEFRTPLNAIIGFAEAMSLQVYGPLSGAYVDYARDIAGAGRHLLALIGDTLEGSAAEHELRPLDAWPIVDEALSIVELAARAKRIELSVDGLQRAVVRADDRKLRQILVNLLGNAVKFTPEGGRVDVAVLRARNSAVEIVVRDTGPGIATVDHARIFDKFEQAAPAEQARQGAGLGLHIARTLAHAMGGDLKVESELGRGARFVLTLAAP
jgi:signal transduction histidine kinase